METLHVEAHECIDKLPADRSIVFGFLDTLKSPIFNMQN